VARYPGSQSVIYLATTSAGAAVNVPNLTKFGIGTPQSLIDVTACNDTNKTYLKDNIPDYKGSFDVWFDDTNTANLFTAAAQTAGCKMYCYPSANAAGRYWHGPAWVVISNFDSGGIGGGAKLSVTWGASGAWAAVLA
jgi:hypothetical protein